MASSAAVTGKPMQSYNDNIDLSEYFDFSTQDDGQVLLTCKSPNCEWQGNNKRQADARRHLATQKNHDLPFIFVAGWCDVCGQNIAQSAHYKNHYRLIHDSRNERRVFLCNGPQCEHRLVEHGFKERNQVERHVDKCPEAQALLPALGNNKKSLWSGREKEYKLPPGAGMIKDKARAEQLAAQTSLKRRAPPASSNEKVPKRRRVQPSRPETTPDLEIIGHRSWHSEQQEPLESDFQSLPGPQVTSELGFQSSPEQQVSSEPELQPPPEQQISPEPEFQSPLEEQVSPKPPSGYRPAQQSPPESGNPYSLEEIDGILASLEQWQQSQQVQQLPEQEVNWDPAALDPASFDPASWDFSTLPDFEPCS